MSRSDLLTAMAAAVRGRYADRLQHLVLLPHDPEHPDAVDYVFTLVAVVDAREENEDTELVLDPVDNDRPALVHVVTAEEYQRGTTAAARVARTEGDQLGV